jgi:hypothetical protein
MFLHSTVLSLAMIGSFVLGRSAPAQSRAHREHDPRIADAPTLPVVLVGIVLEPSGAPAAGAVVVSSAGGKAVTGFDGRYRLEVQVPVDAESLQITAVADQNGGSLRVSTSIGLSPSSTPVEPLVLAPGTSCQPRWLPTFGSSPELDGLVRAQAIFDDGSGPALYAGGDFTTAGGVTVNHVAKWDGSRWAPLGSGVNLYRVNALTVHDDGSGAALYAGGYFTSAGGVAANYVARWDGSSWSAVGSGVNSIVHALAVFDDGNGPLLYAGGNLTTGIRKWNGSGWSAVGFGVNGEVRSLTVFDDGSGPALYVGGYFTTAGARPANRIAKWDGSSWTSLGLGMGDGVLSLTSFDDGGGPALYAGGRFVAAGGISANRIARWDGSSWSALGSGVSGQSAVQPEVLALTAFDDGSGPALYAGGDFTIAGGSGANRIARWDGASWAPLGSGTSVVRALAVVDDGSGPALCTGTVKWDGASWAGLSTGLNDAVHALTVFDDGSGPALHAGGEFTDEGGVATNRIAKWEGAGWAALASGIDDDCPYECNTVDVSALASFDDGSGTALFVGGKFASASGVGAGGLARWDGASWAAPLGAIGPPFPVHALAVFDDGNGPALYLAGPNQVTRWDGASLTTLGGGMNGAVDALTVFDDGNGPALHAGGFFTSAGGVAANHIAKWDGASWSPLGGGMNGPVHALAVFDPGSGPVLVSGSSGGPHHIARWNGSRWSPMHGGMNAPVHALTVFDDGSGPALYAGGEFTIAGGLAVNRIAKWDGSEWSALGGGTSGAVEALTVFDDGDGPDLYVGGDFVSALDSGDSYLARWGCPLVTIQSRVRRR